MTIIIIMEWWPLVRCFPRTCPAGDVGGVPFYFTSQSPGSGRDHWGQGDMSSTQILSSHAGRVYSSAGD